jgi:hypothetical protein
MTTTAKPRWVECADEASKVLTAARIVTDRESKDGIVNEAHAWMNLACIYRDGQERKLTES